MPRRRAFKKKKATPKGYDSGLEYDLHKDLLSGWNHHTEKLPYVSSHTYEPDFVREYGERKVFIEVKGRFRENSEAAKYVAVRECLPAKSSLIFIFQDANKPMPFAKKRKDGTKYTHGEWATKNEFKYFCYKSSPDLEKQLTRYCNNG